METGVDEGCVGIDRFPNADRVPNAEGNGGVGGCDGVPTNPAQKCEVMKV